MSAYLLRLILRYLARIDDARAAPWTRRWGARFLRWSERARVCSERNLAAVYPDLDAAERAELALRSATHSAWGLLETARIGCWPAERLFAGFEEPVGQDLFDSAVAAGRGVLVIAPHFGAWELMSVHIQHTCGVPVSVLYKPPKVPGAEEVITERRQSFGGTLVPPTRAGLKVLHRTLREGGVAGVLPDQRPKAGQGEVVPFMGLPAETGVLVPRLARRTGCAAVYGVLERTAPGRYRQHYLAPAAELWSEDATTALTALNEGIERCVAIDPAQYLWSYKRFLLSDPDVPHFYEATERPGRVPGSVPDGDR